MSAPTPRDDAVIQSDAEKRDPYLWLHNNGFSWDDVNAIAAILDQGGYALTRREPLDVEVLAEAYHAAHQSHEWAACEFQDLARDYAREVAAEYARLEAEP